MIEKVAKSMKVSWNPEQYDIAIRSLEGMARHKKETNSLNSDQMFYEFLARYHKRVRYAQEAGKLVAAVGTGIPVEIIDCFDIVPLHLWWASNMLVAANRIQEEAFSEARRYGLAPELCASHRGLIGAHLKRWIPPPDFVIWCAHVCTNCCDTPEIVSKIWNVPSIFLDRPWQGREEDIAYYASELAEMVAFLENKMGRTLDYDRLRERLGYAWDIFQLETEIHELKKAVPSPSWNRRTLQFHMINRLYAGMREAVDYSRAVRDEMKEALATGQGMPPKEEYRLITVGGNFPSHNRRLAEWMQLEKGAVIVADPCSSHWGPWQPDFSDPLTSLAAEYYADPVTWTSMGPIERAIESAVEDAKTSRAEGGIFMASSGCIQNCSKIRTLSDALRERLGIPTLVLNMDVFDPSFVTEPELKEKLEGFFEALESARS